jgi:hypothetical protein
VAMPAISVKLPASLVASSLSSSHHIPTASPNPTSVVPIFAFVRQFQKKQYRKAFFFSA